MATFERRTLKDGRTRIRAWVRLKGVSEFRTFGTKEAARSWATRLEAAILEGFHRPVGDGRVEDLIDSYLDEEVASWESQARRENDLLIVERLRKRAVTRRGHLKFWNKQLGGLRLEQLSARTIKRGILHLRDSQNLAPGTINRYLASLSALCSWAAHPEQAIIESNPVADVARLEEPPPVAKPLERAAVERLKAAAQTHGNWRIYPALLVGLCCGARRRTIETLRWEQLLLDEQIILFPVTKSKKPVRAPITDEAADALRQVHAEHRRVGVPWVFWSTTDARQPAGLRSAWYTIRDAAGIKDRWHDATRATAATWLHDAGASIYDIMEIVGWRTTQTPKRYIRVSDERKRNLLKQAHQDSSSSL